MSNMMQVYSVANGSFENRPVMIQDIAAKLGMPIGSVKCCLHANSKMSASKIATVRKVANDMGYDPFVVASWCGKKYGKQCVQSRIHEESCPICGETYLKKSGTQKCCPSCRDQQHTSNHPKFYRNGCFHTKEEEVARMKELRTQGYSNAEIAKAVGRSYNTVLDNIGLQDPELSKQNVAMAQHIRAQKNAARKQYVLNKPIREYNARVEKHNKMKAELALMQVELLSEKPVIEKAAQTQISFPLVDLKTLQPTALQ